MTNAAKQALSSFSEIILPVSLQTLQHYFILTKCYGARWSPSFLKEICNKRIQKNSAMLRRTFVDKTRTLAIFKERFLARRRGNS